MTDMTEVQKPPAYLRKELLGKCIGEIFESKGFRRESMRQFLLLAERNENKYIIGVKAFVSIRKRDVNDVTVISATNELVKLSLYPHDGRIPILVIVGCISEEVRKQLCQNFKSLVILDICNLLHMVRENVELRNKFVSQLPFPVDDLKPAEPNFDVPEADGKVDLLKEKPSDGEIQLLEKWTPRKDKGKAYEALCVSVLTKLFSDDLYFYPPQTTSNEGLFRFDLICKIKSKGVEFWEMAEQYFRSKYIVFEFKDYQEPITQKEIFTTVKYLYPKALRSVAIMCCSNGIDDHANRAIRGILREEGKLIIALSNDDLIEMLRNKQRGIDPAEHLSGKLDELLISLEK